MTEADLLVLRTAMVSQRRALLGRLAPDTAGENLTVGQVIDTHTAIVAVDAELNAEHIVVERVTP
jgi:hypothetical protein